MSRLPPKRRHPSPASGFPQRSDGCALKDPGHSLAVLVQGFRVIVGLVVKIHGPLPEVKSLNMWIFHCFELKSGLRVQAERLAARVSFQSLDR